MYSTFCSNNHSNHKNIAGNTKTYKTVRRKYFNSRIKTNRQCHGKIKNNKKKQTALLKKPNRKLKNDQHEPYYHSISCLHM